MRIQRELAETETSVNSRGDDKRSRLEPKMGVGKNTVTALLGMALRDIGKKLGLLDVDLFGSS